MAKKLPIVQNNDGSKNTLAPADYIDGASVKNDANPTGTGKYLDERGLYITLPAATDALLYTASQGLTPLQKYYARDNAGVPIQVAKILAPNGTDTGAMKAGDVIGGYTLQLNDLVFCQSSFAEDSGCFLVGSTTSILVYQTALVQIQIGLSGGKIFTLKPAVGYEELVTGGGGGITEEDSIVNALIFG